MYPKTESLGALQMLKAGYTELNDRFTIALLPEPILM